MQRQNFLLLSGANNISKIYKQCQHYISVFGTFKFSTTMGANKNQQSKVIIESMKKLFLFMAINLVTFPKGYSQNYQAIDSLMQDTVSVDTITQDSGCFTPKDSLFLNYISSVADYIVESIEYVHPRYKMYRTENLYNLIELDTATGRLWLVQFGMNRSSSRMKVAIDKSTKICAEIALNLRVFLHN